VPIQKWEKGKEINKKAHFKVDIFTDKLL